MWCVFAVSISQACINLCVLLDKADSRIQLSGAWTPDSRVWSLDTWFQNLESSQVLKTASSKLLDPRDRPKDAAELANFGTAELNALLPLFGGNLNFTEMQCNLPTSRRVEWPKLRAAVKRLPMGLQSPSLSGTVFQTTNDTMSVATFSSYLALYWYSLLPTAGVEGGFSTVKRTKTGGASSTPALCPNGCVSALKAQTPVSTTVCKFFRDAGRSKWLTWCFTPSQPVWSCHFRDGGRNKWLTWHFTPSQPVGSYHFRDAGRSKWLTWCFTPSQPAWSYQGKTRSVIKQLLYKEKL